MTSLLANRWNVLTVFCVAIGISFLTGCRKHGVPTVLVSGTVTFDGGQMPGEGRIFFTPIEAAEGFTSRPGNGHFGVDGKFTVQSFESYDGLIPGRYAVAIHCWEVPPAMGGPPEKSYLARKYHNGATSGFELDVKPDSRGEEVTYDVSSK